MEEKDSYKTILKASPEVLFKDRNSKFYGFAYPVTSEEDVKEQLDLLKKKHYQAGHWCYAYVLGKSYEYYRANDDGEPSNSAGAPIHGQLQSFDLTNTLVVVVRYFGGTKLGVSGLINAYRTTAQLALEACKIVQRTIDIQFTIQFEYALMSKVMRLIDELSLKIVNQKMEFDCVFTLAVRKSHESKVIEQFNQVYGVNFLAEE